MSKQIAVSENQDFVTVIVQLGFDPELKARVLELSKLNLPIFAKQKGFISGTAHLSADEKSLLTYLQWETVEDHLNCMKSQDFDVEEGRAMTELIESGKVKFEVNVYSVEHIFTKGD